MQSWLNSPLLCRLRVVLATDVGILVCIALAKVALHTLVNSRYGFHRDELLTLNNARHLAWGYVVSTAGNTHKLLI